MQDIVDTGSVYEIHFRFQPFLKKLLVTMVRSTPLVFYNLEF